MCSEHPLCLLSTENQHAFLLGTTPEKYNPGGAPPESARGSEYPLPLFTNIKQSSRGDPCHSPPPFFSFVFVLFLKLKTPILFFLRKLPT